MSEWQGRFSRRASRSRDEALAIARKVEAELIAQPSAFEALAARYSDDPLTRDLGGRLGVLPLDEVPVVMQDAANLLRPGEISPLIESTTGFHLIKLDDAPKAQRVGGQRVVIGYAGSLAGPPLASPGLPSRDDALATARAIVKEARTGPEALLEIARRRAAPDALATGKTGVWSSRDAPPHHGRRSGARRALAPPPARDLGSGRRPLRLANLPAPLRARCGARTARL